MNDEFSNEEWGFLINSSPMRLKPGILQKIEKSLSEVHEALKDAKVDYSDIFPAWADGNNISGKIYRGENYLGMPWIALDYPRNYGQNTSLAFRVLVLWGDGIYTSMLSEGNAEVTMKNGDFEIRSKNKTYYVDSDNRWIQHISETECAELNQTEQAISHRNTHGFTRLFQRIEFDQWPKFKEICLEHFRNQCSLIQIIMQKRQDV
jgi:hypothetical protein